MNALSVIDDVLSTGTLQARKNALTALRIVGTKDSIDRLIAAAVTSEDQLRERAVAEIRQLDAAQTELAQRSLREEARIAGTRDPAYRVYGMLGWRIDGSISARIRNAWRLAGTLYRGQSWRDFAGRMMPDALVAAACAAVALSVALMALLDLVARGMGEIFLWSCLIAVALGAIAAWRVSPIGMQSAGGWPALATEIVIPGLTVLAVSGALGVVLSGSLSIFTDFDGLPASTALLAALALGVTVSAARAGSALAHRLFGQQLLDTLVPTLAGSAAGVAVLSAATAFLRSSEPASTFSYFDYAWPALACAAFGVAAGFTRIDAKSPTRKRAVLASVLRGAAALAIIGIISVAGMFAFARARVPVDAVVASDDLPDEGIVVEKTPFLIRLDGSSSGAVGTTDESLAVIQEVSDDLVLRFYDDSKKLLADADSPVQVPLYLEPGEDYWLAVLRYQESSPLESAASEVAEMFPVLIGVSVEPLASQIDAEFDLPNLGPLYEPVTLRFESPLPFREKVTVTGETRSQVTQIPYILPIQIDQRGQFAAQLSNLAPFSDLSAYSDLSIRLYDTDGKPISEYSAMTFLRHRVDPGTYFLAVGSYSNEENFSSISEAVSMQRTQALVSMSNLNQPVDLSLQLRKPTTGPWQLGEPEALPINVQVTELPFSAAFTLSAEATINAAVGSHREDLLLLIYDESGVELAYGDDPPEARQALQAGEYYAVVALYGDEDVFSIADSLSEGSRFIDISRFPLPDPPRLTIQAIELQRVSLAPDDTAVPTDPIEISALPFILPLQLDANERVAVDADISTSDLDLVVDLYDANGFLFDQADDPPILATRVDRGAYYVVVREYGVLDQETSVVAAIQGGEQSVALLLDDIPPLTISVRVGQ